MTQKLDLLSGRTDRAFPELGNVPSVINAGIFRWTIQGVDTHAQFPLVSLLKEVAPLVALAASDLLPAFLQELKTALGTSALRNSRVPCYGEDTQAEHTHQ